MAEDQFPTEIADGPADDAADVTPSDTVDLGAVTRGLYVGVAGDVAVIMKDGGAVTFSGLAAGVAHPLRVSRVKATGTTATGIVALY